MSKQDVFNKVIALNQLLGALLILGANASAMVQGHTSLTPLYVIGCLATVAFSSVASILLWRGKPMGKKLSLFVQGVQIVGVVMPNAMYQIQLGTEAGVSFTFVDSAVYMTLSYGIHGLFGVWLGAVGPETVVTINAVALAAFIYLLRGKIAFPRRPWI
jgi:hypothetical protein